MNLTFAFQVSGIGFFALLLSYLGILPLRRWAERRQILDIPNERSSHTLPKPLGGGIAIVFFSLTGFTAAWLFSQTCSIPSFFAYFFGALIIAVVSWRDDLRPLRKRIRFAAHSIGAVLVIFTFGYWQKVNLPLLRKMK